MTTILTNVTATQSLTGDDVLFIDQVGSVNVVGAHAISNSGPDNLSLIHGLAAASNTVVYFSGTAVDSTVSIGETGRVVGLSQAHFAVYTSGTRTNIVNHGQISGPYAVSLSGTDSVLTNTGLIEALSGVGSNVGGVLMYGDSETVMNSGHIFGKSFGVGARVSAPTNGTIINSGQITGDVGVLFESGTDVRLENSGTITGTSGKALYLDIDKAYVLNTGTIVGDVEFDNTGGFLKNSGEIHGDVILDETGSYYKGAVDGWASGGVRGNIGNDTIYGASGFDYIEGGEGNDYVKGRAGNDRIFADEGADTVRGNDGDDEIEGNKGTDLLFGGRGDDTIRGGGGNDTIKGGSGDDELTGGSNADVFIFGFRSGIDEITDFNNNTDKLDLSALALTDVSDLTAASAIVANGSGSIIDLTALGGDGAIYVEDMAVGQWNNADCIF